jgi:RNA polymerase sigma-70 factor, ECF subfamily
VGSGGVPQPLRDASRQRPALHDNGLAAGHLAAPASRIRAVSTVTDQLEEHRVALTAYCRRRLGPLDAEDAVQETFVHALHAADQFEGRGTLRGWLYRIAKHVCIDMLEGRKRGALPMDLGPTREGITGASRAQAEVTWIERPDGPGRVDASSDPAAISESREAVERALAAALHYLPPKQRGVVLLREVLHWKAQEVAELLGTSVAAVNSALQRAHATLDSRAPTADTPISIDEAERDVFNRYVRAFERGDVAGLAQLVHDEALSERTVATSMEKRLSRHDFEVLEDAA